MTNQKSQTFIWLFHLKDYLLKVLEMDSIFIE
jgi:hypothetical protein